MQLHMPAVSKLSKGGLAVGLQVQDIWGQDCCGAQNFGLFSILCSCNKMCDCSIRVHTL